MDPYLDPPTITPGMTCAEYRKAHARRHGWFWRMVHRRRHGHG